MTQNEALRQWWNGLTATERQAVLRLPLEAGLPETLAMDLAENGVSVVRVNPRAVGSPAVSAFPDVLREHLTRLRHDRSFLQTA